MTAAFESMTPAQLRAEAGRRELVDRHRTVMERIVAREAIAEQLVAMPTATVIAANARGVLTAALDALVLANDAESLPTNGEINLVSTDTSFGWWHDAIADHPRRDPDSVLERRRRRRVRLWDEA